MPKSQRIEEIDMLRGLSMFIMISLHTNAYFLSIPFVFLLWDFGEFAVPIFIFCSSYLFFMKNPSPPSWKGIFLHIKKRFVRLLVPYYLFAVVFTLLELIKEPWKITFRYIIENILVVGGIPINWLVLLFVSFTFLMPFILYIYTRRRVLFYLFIFLSAASAFLLMFYPFPLNYRFIFWLPWSLLVVFSLIIIKNEKQRWFFPLVFLVSFFVFLLLRYLQLSLHHSLTMFDNKYPPNLYHLTFGIVSIVGLYVLAKRGLFSVPLIKNLLFFLSKNSYSLFFIHWIIIYIATVLFHPKFNWWTFFLTVLSVSLVSQFVLNYLFSILKRGPTI